MFYQSYSKILFKLRQPAISEPDNTWKSYLPQKKVLNRGTWFAVYFGLSFEVYNSFLCHLALKWQVVSVWREFLNMTGKTFWTVSFLEAGLHMRTVPKNRDEFTINNLFYYCKALTSTHPLVYEFLCVPF